MHRHVKRETKWKRDIQRDWEGEKDCESLRDKKAWQVSTKSKEEVAERDAHRRRQTDTCAHVHTCTGKHKRRHSEVFNELQVKELCLKPSFEIQISLLLPQPQGRLQTIKSKSESKYNYLILVLVLLLSLALRWNGWNLLNKIKAMAIVEMVEEVTFFLNH